MKRFCVVFLVFYIISNSLYAQTPSSTLVFEERVFNFGTIQEKKGKVSHTFEFQNNGKEPVTIDEVISGCGCISKLVSTGTVNPGGKGKVTITFDPVYKSGFFSKEIVVLSSNRQHYNRIWVEGNIEPMEHPIEDDYPYNFGSGLHMRLKVMAFGYLKPGEIKQMELHYANSSKKEMVLNFIAESNILGLHFSNPGKIKPGARGVIKFSFMMPNVNSKEILHRLHPYVNNIKIKETLDIKVLNGDKLN